VPPNPAHLPERFGLFTLILLGEAVVAVMHGMKSQEDWSVAAAASAFSGMAFLFLVWCAPSPAGDRDGARGIFAGLATKHIESHVGRQRRRCPTIAPGA
jgi:hypothetical protein